jgi:mRNA interferase MazF
VSFDPTLGAEIKKVRPALVISSDSIRALPLRMVAPITDWSAGRKRHPWHIYLTTTPSNGLSKTSTVDCLQIRSLDLSRFDRRLGRIEDQELKEVCEAVGLIIEL